ncbi:MAG: tRNA (adenosine(37)-N6)-threonylcarbamoyltransferase complex dimerization subunit type 1 TsaB [Planctomycetota bacterium]
MNILALETTERIGSVAAMSNGNLLLELNLDSEKRSAQSLAPGISALLEKVGWRPRDVGLVATTIGPGSFTGLRVGVATAKGFAYAVEADILGVDTLEVIATRAPADREVVSAAVDAQRGDAVAATYRRGKDGHFEAVRLAELVDVDTWLSTLPEGAAVTGPILRKMARRVPEHLTVLAPEYWAPRAATVARVAARLYAAGRRDNVWNLVPQYSRRSAAEEKWEKRQSRTCNGQ